MLERIKNFFTSKSQKPDSHSITELLKQKSAEEWICPPAPPTTQADYELALARVAYEDCIWEMLFNMSNYIKFKHGMLPETSYWYQCGEEWLLKEALDAVKEFDEVDKLDDDQDWWDGYLWDGIKEGLKTGLSAAHAGDCTALPCTCMRCYAEDMYKVPSTANFNKSQGNKLYHEYVKYCTVKSS